MDADSIKEKANSADENITFTDGACETMTQIPASFVDMGINMMVEKAKEKGVDTIDTDFLKEHSPVPF
jgi:hypothetical protein